MISVKIALVMLIGAFAFGSFLAPPVQQAIAAVIATDVQCMGCVGTSDVAGNSITGAKIKDGEVKAAEIATDAVGATELQGVTKLLFAKCVPTVAEATTSRPAGTVFDKTCFINGASADDSAVVTFNDGAFCFKTTADTDNGSVQVRLHNTCPIATPLGEGSTISIIVYHK